MNDEILSELRENLKELMLKLVNYRNKSIITDLMFDFLAINVKKSLKLIDERGQERKQSKDRKY